MSRSDSDGSDKGHGGGSRRGGARGRGAAPNETHTLVAFLRDLAERAERDPSLADHLREALRASGLLDAASRSRPEATGQERAPTPVQRSARPAAAAADDPPDPFVLLRERGEAGLRASLAALDLAALRTIVRSHRLDPARISARWTTRERVIELIVRQVCGRANLGKAFSRV